MTTPPLVRSMLDSDYYKWTMAQLVFHRFPNAIAIYNFINRGKHQFPQGFDKALSEQIHYLNKLSYIQEEMEFLRKNRMQEDYVEWLSQFHFDPSQVEIKQNGTNLDLTIRGPWKETIFWEIPLMAIVSELYYKMTKRAADMEMCRMRAGGKGKKLSGAGVKWADFGTRRRFSYDTQNILVGIHKNEMGFIGTSNLHFAMKYGVTPIGTFAHESVMGMQAKYGFRDANSQWLNHWLDEYKGDLGIALTDTLTTDQFLKVFNKNLANWYAGVRHDSGDPFAFGEKIIDHYKKLGVDPKIKTIVFSDALTTDKVIELHNAFKDRIGVIFGIGTHLTNDCGHKPMNIVIKMVGCDFGEGMKNIVKLSDVAGKHTGDHNAILKAKKELGII